MSGADATLVAIWSKRVKRGPMDSLESVELAPDLGLVGSADARPGRRQVTLLCAETWETVCRELGAEVDPRLRRANLLVRGLDLEASRGKTVRIGPCRVLIHGETRPCRLMDEQHPGLQEALSPPWRGGAYGSVQVGGTISLGDPVAWAEDADEAQPASKAS